MTDTAITWVHLSDFHAGQRGEPVWHAIERGFKDDLLEMRDLLGAPDLLLFTGVSVCCSSAGSGDMTSAA